MSGSRHCEIAQSKVTENFLTLYARVGNVTFEETLEIMDVPATKLPKLSLNVLSYYHCTMKVRVPNGY
jgi:hypothetical protein